MNAAQQPVQPAEWQQFGVTPGLVLRAFGMRRSGNHAIANWLQRNAPGGKSVFLNNCKNAKSPLEHFAGIEVNGAWVRQRGAAQDLPRLTREAGDGAMLLITYEDTSPAEFLRERKVSGSFNEALIDREVLIYRSFLNWSASLLKKLQGNPGYSVSQRNAILMRSFDRYTRLLGILDIAQADEVTGICYDDWFAGEEYRAETLQKLGLELRDNAVGDVQKYGGGSSFQKQATDPQQLDTQNRWRQMAGDPCFQAVLMLATQDDALMDVVSRRFPADAAVLTRLAANAPIPEGILT